MIDIWARLVSDQFEIALNLTRAVLGIDKIAPVSVRVDHNVAVVPDQADAPEANQENEPGQETGREKERFAVVVTEEETLREAPQISGSGAGKIPERQLENQTGSVQAVAVTTPGILSFLESANRGATVREIAEHLEMDKRTILPLLKTLVKEGRIDELLGRYCMLKS